MNEVCSVRLEAELSEPLRSFARPLFPEAAKSREPVRCLNSEDFSPKVENEPIEELR